jgi:hypothetical protein
LRVTQQNFLLNKIRYFRNNTAFLHWFYEEMKDKLFSRVGGVSMDLSEALAYFKSLDENQRSEMVDCFVNQYLSVRAPLNAYFRVFKVGHLYYAQIYTFSKKDQCTGVENWPEKQSRRISGKLIGCENPRSQIMKWPRLQD